MKEVELLLKIIQEMGIMELYLMDLLGLMVK
jgi:hypothetical protein